MSKFTMATILLALSASSVMAAERQVLECTTVGKGTLKGSIIETAIEARFSVKYTNPNHQMVGGVPLTAIVSSELKKESPFPIESPKMGTGWGRGLFYLTWLNGKPIASIHSNKFSAFLGADLDYCENLTLEQGNQVEHALQVPVYHMWRAETTITFNCDTTPAKVK